MRASEHRDDDRRTVRVTWCILNLIGAWPSRGVPSIFGLAWMRTQMILCQILLYFIFVPGMLKIFFKESNARRRLKMIGPMCNCLMAMLKHMALISHSDRLKDCIKHIEEDWRKVSLTEDRAIMTGKSRICRNLTILCAAFVYGSGFSYRTIVPLSRGVVITPQNLTLRPLGFDGYYVFFDPQKTPAYEITFICQFLSGIMQYSVTCGTFGLAALFVLHACSQLKILSTRIEDLTRVDHLSDNITSRKLAAVVKRHIRIKSFLNKVEEILQFICLVEVIGSAFIMCLLGYYIIIEWEDNDAVSMLTYSILLVTFIFNIFILCFIGELLTHQSMEMHITSCTLDWYRIPYKTAHDLILMIALSAAPAKITAAKFMDLSLNSFGAIVRTSVAYLNLLRTISI